MLSVLVGALSMTTLAARQPLLPGALATQIALDRAGFSPGEIDGSAGANTTRAREAFCQAHHLRCLDVAAVAKALNTDDPTATTSYTITDQDAAGPFVPDIPADLQAQAQLPALSYTSPLEMLGERFHAAPALLKRLNPGVTFEAGQTIVVPNVTRQPPTHLASRVVVSRTRSGLTVFDDRGEVVFFAPVTSGSQHDPLPLGRWTVVAVLQNPQFHYNPALFWDAEPGDAKVTLPPGPNGPVGTVWIDLSKPNYGLHGTPEPSEVGHTASHGCVRLTNWDAETVASLVRKGTPVVFEQ